MPRRKRASQDHGEEGQFWQRVWESEALVRTAPCASGGPPVGASRRWEWASEQPARLPPDLTPGQGVCVCVFASDSALAV